MTSLESKSWAYGSGGHLRAVWRLSVFVCVLFAVDAVLQGVAAPTSAFVSAHLHHMIAVSETFDLIAALVAVAFVLRSIDDERWAAVGLQLSAWRTSLLVRGALLGAGTIGAAALVLLVFGQMQFVPDSLSDLLSGDTVSHSLPVAWLISTARLTLLLAPAAMFEELIFRGYLWRVFEDSAGPQVALVVTSILFGLVHLQNPGANSLAIANVMLAGVALGLVRHYTNSLPAAWAAHLAWNWIMAAALHVAVSGLPIATPGYRTLITGASFITGGSWGPEGGIVATAVLVAAIVFGVRKTSFIALSHNIMRRDHHATAAGAD